jgi:hypothetical protein
VIGKLVAVRARCRDATTEMQAARQRYLSAIPRRPPRRTTLICAGENGRPLLYAGRSLVNTAASLVKNLSFALRISQRDLKALTE